MGSVRYTLGGSYNPDNSQFAKYEGPKAGVDGSSPYSTLDDATLAGGSTNYFLTAAGHGTYLYDTTFSRILSGSSATFNGAGLSVDYSDNMATLSLAGGDFGDVLYAGAGGDTLNGGSGADTMAGGTGNDLFYVDDKNDQVIESKNAAGGTKDKVLASADWTMTAGSGVEVIRANAEGLFLTGGDGRQKVVGGAASDNLDGAGGNDKLVGEAGEDGFVFSTALNKDNNVDKIADFAHGTDEFKLSSAVFLNLPGNESGLLDDAAFKDRSMGKTDGDDRIIYNQATGYLYYDQDGSGTAHGAVKFAHIDNGATLTASDFLVF